MSTKRFPELKRSIERPPATPFPEQKLFDKVKDVFSGG
jgi:hypothetical protein